MSKQENRSTNGQACPNGNTVIAEQWADFREQFRTLAKRANGIIEWFSIDSRKAGAWELNGIVDVEETAANEFVAEFKTLATRAARYLEVPEGITPLEYWIQSVKMRTFNACSDSVSFCSEMEKQALELELVGVSEASTNQVPAGRRGPEVNMKRHRAIASVIETYGSKWKEQSNLAKICRTLDKQSIDPPRENGRPNRIGAKWFRRLQDHTDRVIKAIEHSLKKVSEENSRKL